MTYKRSIATLIMVFGMFVCAANGETIFVANLDGAQQVPSNGTSAKGFGVIRLNDAETEITYSAKFSGLSGNNTIGSINFGAPGQNGFIQYGLGFAQNPSTSNVSFAQTHEIKPEQVQQLRNGQWYFTVHSVAFPSGEIRGQLRPYSPLTARVNGAQALPANSSNGSGHALVCLNKAEDQFVIWFGYDGLPAANSDAFVFSGRPGTNGSQEFVLSADLFGSQTFGFTYYDISPTQLSRLKAGQLYIQVTSTGHPESEIRGQIKPLNKSADLDGDSRADISVFRNSTGVWYWLDSANGKFNAVPFGNQGFDDRIEPGDYDGDGLTDLAVWRQSNATFYVLRSSNGTLATQPWGIGLTDKPRPADYDGDGKTDFAVYRKGVTSSSPSVFWILESNTGAVRATPWGLGSDFSMPGDFDGDRIEDVTVVRNQGGQFVYYTLTSGGEIKTQYWGNVSQHYALSGDFDGDGKTDPAAFTFGSIGSPTVGNWWVLGSRSGVTVTKWGDALDDALVPADYDGDGSADLAVFRNGQDWYILRSSDGALAYARFGTGTDTPLTKFQF
ncbi:MAG: CHRD domain-containing protein [Pyrinomonadaceae bacterium]